VYHHNHHVVTRKHKEEDVSKHKLESTYCAVVRAAQPHTMEVKHRKNGFGFSPVESYIYLYLV
jgi:hypothetical protein